VLKLLLNVPFLRKACEIAVINPSDVVWLVSLSFLGIVGWEKLRRRPGDSVVDLDRSFRNGLKWIYIGSMGDCKLL
jgi:hypothetical protein